MKRILFFLLVLAAFAPSALAELVAVTDTVRFGIIREADGVKTVRTYIRNEGSEPAAILKLQATCGCTATKFQKDDIAPGDSAWIELTYNPYRRPGSFEKGIKIFPVNGEMFRLPITGTVYASEETIGNMFPKEAGVLHITEDMLVPATPLTARRSLYIDVYNDSDMPVWQKLETGHDAVSVQYFPQIVAPGDRGTVGIYLDPRKEPRSGDIEYRLLYYTSYSADSLKDAVPKEIIIKAEKP